MPFNPYVRKRTEPDLRKEMESFLSGSAMEIPKGQITVLRKMRRDSSGNLIECDCVDAFTKEEDRDTWCPQCAGSRYLWDESLIDAYKVVIKSDVGNAQLDELARSTLMNIPIALFYTRYSVDLTFDDKIVELVRNKEGVPVKPYKREAIYGIGTLFPFRSDNGRIEFWKVGVYKEKHKFLNGPSGI